MFAGWNERICGSLIEYNSFALFNFVSNNFSASLSRKIQNLRDMDKIKIPPEPPGQCSKALQVSAQIQKEKRKMISIKMFYPQRNVSVSSYFCIVAGKN